MALELLQMRLGVDVLDIHAGGVDLIFPHHEDEIAQSCAYTGQDLFARVWLHGEFLKVDGTKMSKRYGNILTPRDLREAGVPAEALRMLIYGTHYRKMLDWSDDALAAARQASARLGEFRRRLLESKSDSDSLRVREAAERLGRDASAALDDDLNAPRALAAMFAFMNDANAAMDAGEQPGPIALKAWDLFDGVLGVTGTVVAMKITDAGSPSITEPDVTPPRGGNEEALKTWALQWAVRRKKAKTDRDYVRADSIRGLLRDAGWEVRDAKDGSVDVIRVGRGA
jgi:cysteinyl-tRNA synthetase